ncbi:hypothetical protein GCM10010216_69220 [Streptomyces flaveolus]|nr:hypothetical protein GCM10010216_69220 [Streptomyces flaveolus]
MPHGEGDRAGLAPAAQLRNLRTARIPVSAAAFAAPDLGRDGVDEPREPRKPLPPIRGLRNMRCTAYRAVI